MNSIKKILKETDWILLIFLFIFLNQAMFGIKALGLVFIYIVRPNFKFGLFKGRMPKFYLLIILLAIVNLFTHIKDFSSAYLVAFSVGCLFWVGSLLAYHQVKLSTERHGQERMHCTIMSFTLLNLFFSAWQYFRMSQTLGFMDPFDPGLDIPYGISAGDNIFGFFLDFSYFNVMVSAFLAIYFLFKKNILFVFIATTTVLVVFANTCTLIYMVALSGIFLFSLFTLLLSKTLKRDSHLLQWMKQVSPPRISFLLIPLIFCYIFAVSYLISPQNFYYSYDSLLSRKDQRVTADEQRVVAANRTVLNEEKALKQPGKSAKKSKTNGSGAAERQTALQTGKEDTFYKKSEAIVKEAIHNFKGKKLSYFETYSYLASSPSAMLLGAGPVRFSSITAQRMAGYDSSRLFSKVLPRFISPEYSRNHLMIFDGKAAAPPEYRSALNWPDSFYNQLFGEYGLLGAILFLVFYVGYFVKRIRQLSYGIWLGVLLVPFAVLIYLFESFSVIIIFEWLMETDLLHHRSKSSVDG